MKLAAIFYGDRDYDLAKMRVVQDVFDLYLPDVLIEGECRGADLMARVAAEMRGRSVEAGTILPFPADWKRKGRAAGPIRNREMLDRLLRFRVEGWEVLAVGFHDRISESLGTAGIQALAAASGVRTLLVDGGTVVA